MSKRRGSIQALCKQRFDFVEKTFDLLGARCILVLLRCEDAASDLDKGGGLDFDELAAVCSAIGAQRIGLLLTYQPGRAATVEGPNPGPAE